jgi:hypothetical protein
MLTIKLKKDLINKKFILIGYGRWSQIYLKVLRNYVDRRNIFVYSKSNFLNLKKNHFVLDQNKIKNINHSIFKRKGSVIILLNNNLLRKKFLLIALKYNLDCIYEKPYLEGLKKLNELLISFKKKKLKFMISLPWCHNNVLIKVKKKSRNIFFDRINVKWFEKKNQRKYGLIKRRNLKMSYYKDIISHIISIVSYFIDTSFSPNPIINSNKLLLNNKVIKLNLCRNSKYNIREFSFYKSSKLVLKLNLGKKINLLKKKELIVSQKDDKKDLDRMLMYFSENTYQKIYNRYKNLFMLTTYLNQKNMLEKY